jgi:3-oxoacyl-(acyl-carrier-protein) synthase
MPESTVTNANFPGVAIVGLGAVTAAGRGVESLREAMRRNTTALLPSPRFQQARFQSAVVGTALKEDSVTDDPAWQLAWLALEESQANCRDILANISKGRRGFVLSTTKANIGALERVAEGRPCPDAARRHVQADLLAAELAAECGVGGPVRTVSVACASGLVALQQGARLIQRGQADAVLVAGVDHLSAFVVAGFSSLKALDPAGCRPFDRERCGLSPGEAGAAMVLTRAELAPPGAVLIRGWATSNDANHLTGPSRDGSGLAQAIRAALAAGGLLPGDIDYLNAHGTGTPYNDAMESLAIRSVFGESVLPVSASKGIFGHTLGAAGVLESILCVLAIEEKLLPGTPRLGVPAEGAPVGIMQSPRPADRLNHALKVNTGFGGINAAVIFGRD